MSIDRIVDHLRKKYPDQIAAWDAEYNLKCSGMHSTHEQYTQGLNDYIKERAKDYFESSGTWKLPSKEDLARMKDEETKEIKRLI